MALVALFVHVLEYPDRPGVMSDIQYMDMVSGHLSYLEFATANMEFPIAKEMTNLARLSVASGRAQTVATKEPEPHRHAGGQQTAPAATEQPDFDPALLDDVRSQSISALIGMDANHYCATGSRGYCHGA